MRDPDSYSVVSGSKLYAVLEEFDNSLQILTRYIIIYTRHTSRVIIEEKIFL